MKTFSSCLICLIFFLTANNTFSQSTGLNYVFSQPAGTMTYNSSAAGAVTIISGGADEQVATINTMIGWSGFYFGGKWYQTTSPLYVSSNGWMSFVNPGGNSSPANSLWTTPFIIAPLWDDLKIHLGGSVSYQMTGGPGARCLIVEWRGMLWNRNATDSALSFQALLYDNAQTDSSMRNVIEFRYKRYGSDSSYIVNAGASIGISASCGDVFAFTNSTGAPNHNTPENSAIALKPSDVVSHRFTPMQHPNDECASAEVLVFNPALPLISIDASTVHSTQSAFNLPSCGNPTSVNDVWFTFTKPAGITNFEIYTDSLDCRGVNYATGIEIFSSCGGASIACDYGSAGPGNTNATSYINLVNQACTVQQYWVRAYSRDSSFRGYFRFNLRPPGRTCEYANDFTGCGLPYTSSAGLTTCGFGNDYDSSNSVPLTTFTFGEDYVFSYTTPTNVCIDISLTNTSPNSSPGLFVSKGCLSSGDYIASATGSGGNNIVFNNISLVGGNTYYFLIDNDTTGSAGCLSNFDFSVNLSLAAPPVNDNCIAPINVTVVTSAICTGAFDFNNNCALPSTPGTIPLPSCGMFTDGVTGDVWFKFTSSSANPHVIKIDTGSAPSAEDLALAIYSGNCGNLTFLACDDNSNGMMPLTVGTPLSAGIIYYVRVWSNTGTQPGNFRVCVTNGPISVNDLQKDELFFSVIPNPASEKATLCFDKNLSGPFNINLLDITGRIILSQAIIPSKENNSSELNLTGITSGIYMLQAQNKDRFAMKKIIVE